MKTTKKRVNDSTKILMIGCTFLMTVSFILGIVLVTQSKRSMTVLMRQQMMNAVKAAAASLDGDLLEAMTAEDVESNSEAFQAVLSTLNLFQSNMDMKYIYAVKHLGGTGFVFIVDQDPVAPGKFGEPVIYTDALYQASQGIATVDEKPFSDRWGKFYSAYCPVLDSQGGVAGIVVADYDAEWFDEQIAISAASILFIVALSLLVAAGITVMILNHFRRKIHALHKEITELSEEVDALNQEILPAPDYPSGPDFHGASKKAEAVPSASSFDALGEKLLQAHDALKQYVTHMHEQDYVDALTGVGNRAAYLEMAKSMELQMLQQTADFSLAVFDVNDLRTVNRELGMNVGDQMLVDTATLLLQLFDSAHVFHVGSDEFIVLLDTSSAEEIQGLMARFARKLDTFNAVERKYKKTLSISTGIASHVPGQDRNCSEIYKRADEDLSRKKALYYQQAGDRRKN